ncbi:hypothetical protein [Shimia sagamensis]|uniref:Sulfotransferase family protein n=1 Tax=Shimia sagamensis TaxID=1566352 RepID=A0ABY1NBC2_9RHOB|nr:hypothetical protein [Shimia sagamensis]SMP05459.1 hypothetical protein SAMN06265373_101566 [Shimia sagamensis]
MTKTIYIHIGHYKTGTTALQVFMNSNRQALRDLGTLWNKGVDYPEQFCDLAKHSKLAFSIYREAGVSSLMYGFQNDVPAQTRWNNFFDYVRQSKCPSVLISSEEFMRMGANPAATQLLKDIIAPVKNEFTFKIIAYLRRPDAHLRSWYNQLVKLRQPVPDFNSTVCDVMEPIHYDYSLALKPWIEMFGSKSVIVRPYTEALRENHELFRDFLGVLGIPFDGKNAKRWNVPGDRINLRMEDRFLELTRITQNMGMKAGRPKQLQERFAKLLDDHQLENRSSQSFDHVVETSQRAMETLKASQNTAPLAALFADHLPIADAPDRAEMLNLIQLLLQENATLRNRLNKHTQEVNTRLDTIENQLGTKKPDSQ